MKRSSRMGRGLGFCLAAMAGLCGCASLPNSGPSAGDVAQQAAVDSVQRYEFVDLDPSVVERVNQGSADSLVAHFGDYRRTAEPVIGVGDVVSVTIWEASAGGLFSAPMISDKMSAGSNSATIPEQVVGRDGAITVPYAGRVHVAGRTARAVQGDIEAALQGKAIQPQVLVNVTHAISNTVTVGGEVAAGARVPLSVRGDRLLDVIAAAGGVRAPVNETYVELSRGAKTSRVPLSRVIANPRENIYLQPNDVVTLVRDPQTFIAYGATGRNAEIPFDADGINLAQALAKAGGLDDNRSDPQGVFIFRYEPEPIARAIRPDSPLLVPGRPMPIVYRLNLSDPNSLFVEQNFRIASRDLIFVSNAPFTEVEKVMGVINGGLSTASSLATVTNAASTIK
ncbi:MAG: polysaccharide biosynthesis/export family protein [Roseiarcus sp.]|jgi:polysaccharide export outer membrane protein